MPESSSTNSKTNVSLLSLRTKLCLYTSYSITLIGCVGEAREAGVGMRVASITDRVRLIMKITATEKVMPLDDDVASAIESLA